MRLGLIILVFAAGYLASELSDHVSLVVSDANAQILGVSAEELLRDVAFERAVRRVVEGNCAVFQQQYISC